MANNVSSPAAKGGILLEAGTNELEILVFSVADVWFGVNVAKVREVLEMQGVTHVPESHPAVEGMVRIREDVVPLVDLERFLFGESTTDGGERRLLLLEFNGTMIAFRVHGVERIHRVSWETVSPLPDGASGTGPVTAVVMLDGQLLQLLDFESIGAQVGLSGLASSENQRESTPSSDIATLLIVYADDSPLVREQLKDTLVEAGFTNLREFCDGREAWDYLSETAANQTPESIREHVACIITDVEMPRMDGLTLTRHIRQKPVLEDVPVIVFSSLVSKGNENKGYQVGANAQITKPRYGELIDKLTELCGAEVAVAC